MLCVCMVLVELLLIVEAKNCSRSYSCFNETLSSSSDGFSTLECYGLASCGRSSIVNNGYATACGASQSCQECKRFEGSATYAAHIYGFLGLAWTEYVNITDDNYICYGEASCYSILKSIGYYYPCAGVNSCGNIGGSDGNNDENELKELYGGGMYSFQNSTFYGKSDESIIDIYLYGYYSGLNSTFYCLTGQTCSVYCYVNGCDNFNFVCNSTNGSTCHVYNCDEASGISCPNGWGDNNNNNNNDSGIDNIKSIISSIDVSEGYLLSYLNEDYSNYSNIYDSSHNGECSFECNTYQDSSCNGQILTGVSGLCCSGTESCNDAIVSTVSTIYCDGWKACDSNSMVYVDDIRCRARQSCQYCDAREFNSMMMTGDEACLGCNVVNGYYVGCFAKGSCSSVSISKVEYIVASGYRALLNGEITSNGIGVMNVYLLADEAARGLTITCNENDKCNIYCYNNDTCNDISTITCDGCDEINKYLLFDATFSPSMLPTMSPLSAPGIEPTRAPTNYYLNYTLSLTFNVTDSEWNDIYFYVKLDGVSGDDTDWEEIGITQSMINDNSNEQLLNFSLNLDNVGEPDVLTMVTFDNNSVLFDCFSMSFEENSQSFSDSVCAGKTRISSPSGEYCGYATIDFGSSLVKIRNSDENTACPYVLNSIDESTDDDISEAIVVTDTVTYVVISCISLGILMVIVAEAMAMFLAKNMADPPPTAKIFKFFLHLADFWSDIGLTLVWYLNGKIYFGVASSMSLLLSTFVSGFGAIRLTGKWKNYHIYSKSCPERLENYVTRFDSRIYFLTVMAGLKPTIFLLQSQLFYLEFFNIPLTRYESNSLYVYRACVVIVETLPQWILQIVYLKVYGISGSESELSLLFISFVLSVTSMLVEFMIFANRMYINIQDHGCPVLSSNGHTELKQTIFDFSFAVHSNELKYYHIMTNMKLNQCLDIIFKDKNEAWQSTAKLCKFTSECYYIENRLTSNEINVHCQMTIRISGNYQNIKNMEISLNDCIKNTFDDSHENHKKLKTAICDKLMVTLEGTTISRGKYISLIHEQSVEVRSISTFAVISRSETPALTAVPMIALPKFTGFASGSAKCNEDMIAQDVINYGDDNNNNNNNENNDNNI